MNRTERFYRIDQLLAARGILSREALLEELQVSWATLKRDLAYLKDRFNAPIVFDRDAGGYRFAKPNIGPKYELPGLWFSGDETHALLTMHQLLSELEPGMLAPHIAPLLWKPSSARTVTPSTKSPATSALPALACDVRTRPTLL
jgi:predicted DNA-binding transcriptional regulator YafY